VPNDGQLPLDEVRRVGLLDRGFEDLPAHATCGSPIGKVAVVAVDIAEG
jgi:hypothetical protein